MAIARFFLLWLAMAGGFAALLFLWRQITKTMVISATKLITAGVLSFLLAMFFFVMET